MKIAFVEPVKHLGFTSSLTPITLVNIQSITPQNVEKLAKFKEVIIDNGVFEIFHSKEFSKSDFASNFNKQIEVAEILESLGIKVSVVLPDFPFDMQKTQELVREALSTSCFDNVIGVIQANKPEEIYEMCVFYREWSVDKIAIPVRLREKIPDVFKHIKFWNYDEIHNLGFSLNDLKTPEFFKCASCDTSYPIKCYLTNTPLGEDVKRPSLYLQATIQDENKCLDLCKKFLDMLEGAKWVMNV
jgi:hypothetical protein